MTVSSSVNATQFLGSGSSGPFSFGFKFYANEEISVVKTGTDDSDTLLVEGGDYTLTGAGEPEGGIINLSATLDTGERLSVVRTLDLVQGTAFVDQGAFYPSLHETAMDKLTMMIQQLYFQLKRAIKFPVSTFEDIELPAGDRTDKIIGFDSAGTAGLFPYNALFTSSGTNYPWVDAREYASLAAAVAAIGSTETGLLIADLESVASDLAIPDNITLIWMGGIISPDAGATVTIHSPIHAGAGLLFTGDGTVSLPSTNEVYPEWFGAVADGVTDSAPGIHKAVQSITAGTVKLGSGTYLLSTEAVYAGTNEGAYIVAKSGVNITGQGWDSILKVADGQSALNKWNVILKPQSTGILSNCIFRDFKITGGTNTLTLAGFVARSHRAISATDGGLNILIDNIRFENMPGNSAVYFAGATGTRGNIKVDKCWFVGGGTGITGNHNLDHTDIYFTGDHNKATNNYFKSDNLVLGAMIEFHGDFGEAYGNYGSGYTQVGWIAPNASEGYTTFTETNIHDNIFEDNYAATFSIGGDGDFGRVIQHDNTFTIGSGAVAFGLIYVMYGPDGVGQLITDYIYNDNRIVNNDTTALDFYRPIQTANVKLHNNLITGFGKGVSLPAIGSEIDATYVNYNVSIKDNVFTDCASNVIFGSGSRIKQLTISENTFESSNTTAEYAIHLSVQCDGGYIGGNIVDPSYINTLTFLNNGSRNFQLQQLTPNGTLYDTPNPSATGFVNSRRVLSAPSIPLYGVWGLGDKVVNSACAVGTPKGWVCTVAGGANTGDRADLTAYPTAGSFYKWTTGTTVWEVITAGTSAAAPPSIVGKVVGDNVTDGTVVWQMKSLTSATLTSEGNL